MAAVNPLDAMLIEIGKCYRAVSDAGVPDKPVSDFSAFTIFCSAWKPDDMPSEDQFTQVATRYGADPAQALAARRKFIGNHPNYQRNAGYRNRKCGRKNPKKVVREQIKAVTIKVPSNIAKSQQRLVQATVDHSKATLKHGNTKRPRDSRVTERDAKNFVQANVNDALLPRAPETAFNGIISRRSRN